jgi:hypothetical protein
MDSPSPLFYFRCHSLLASFPRQLSLFLSILIDKSHHHLSCCTFHNKISHNVFYHPSSGALSLSTVHYSFQMHSPAFSLVNSLLHSLTHFLQASRIGARGYASGPNAGASSESTHNIRAENSGPETDCCVPDLPLYLGLGGIAGLAGYVYLQRNPSAKEAVVDKAQHLNPAAATSALSK